MTTLEVSHRLLSVHDVAGLLGVRFASAKELMESQAIASFWVGKRLKTTRAALDAFGANIAESNGRAVPAPIPVGQRRGRAA